MASGVKVHDEVKKVFESMRVRHTGAEQKDQIKFATFKVDGPLIVVDTVLRMKDFEEGEDIFLKSIALLKDACYALYDCSYNTTETPKEDLIFLLWCPCASRVKDKMLYSSSKDGIKKVFTGIKMSMELTEDEELTKANFVDKMGSGSNNVRITALEGMPLK